MKQRSFTHPCRPSSDRLSVKARQDAPAAVDRAAPRTGAMLSAAPPDWSATQRASGSAEKRWRICGVRDTRRKASSELLSATPAGPSSKLSRLPVVTVWFSGSKYTSSTFRSRKLIASASLLPMPRRLSTARCRMAPCRAKLSTCLSTKPSPPSSTS